MIAGKPETLNKYLFSENKFEEQKVFDWKLLEGILPQKDL